MKNSLLLVLSLMLGAESFAAKKDLVVAFVAHKNSADLAELVKLCRKKKLPINFDQNWNAMANRGSTLDIELLQYVHEHCSHEALGEIEVYLKGPLLYKHPEILFPVHARAIKGKADLDFNEVASDLNIQLNNYGIAQSLSKEELLKKLSEPHLTGNAQRLREAVLAQISISYDRK